MQPAKGFEKGGLELDYNETICNQYWSQGEPIKPTLTVLVYEKAKNSTIVQNL